MIDISKLLNWLKTLPTPAKVVSSLLLCALVIVYLLTSCGTTRAVVRSAGKGISRGTITITTNNPTSVEVSPKLDSITISSKK